MCLRYNVITYAITTRWICSSMKNSKVIFAIEEERLSRNKHAISEIPINSIKAALKYKNLKIKDIKSVHVSSDRFMNLKERVKSYLIHHFGSLRLKLFWKITIYATWLLVIILQVLNLYDYFCRWSWR